MGPVRATGAPSLSHRPPHRPSPCCAADLAGSPPFHGPSTGHKAHEHRAAGHSRAPDGAANQAGSPPSCESSPATRCTSIESPTPKPPPGRPTGLGRLRLAHPELSIATAEARQALRAHTPLRLRHSEPLLGAGRTGTRPRAGVRGDTEPGMRIGWRPRRRSIVVDARVSCGSAAIGPSPIPRR